MAATVASRLLGYARDKIIAFQFGRDLHTDAYWAAFSVPDLLYFLLAGGALSAALIPVFTDYLVHQERDEAWRVAVTLANLLVVLVAGGVVLIVVFAPQLVWVAAPGFYRKYPQAVEECVRYVRIMAPMVFMTALSALSTGILQAFQHFTSPAAAWCLYNVGIIFGAVFLAGSLGIPGLCVGVLIGAASMVLVQLPSLHARGFRWRPSLDLKHPGVVKVIRYFLPVMAGLFFTQLCLFWLPNFFGSFYEGGVTSLRYANRLVILPLGLFGVAISTAAFPTLSEHVARGEVAEFKRTFSASLRAIFLLALPSSVALAALAGPIVRLLWQGGKFGGGDVEASAFALVYYSPGLLAISALQIINRAFYSLRDMKTPPLVGAGYVVFNLALAPVLMGTGLRYGGVALATSLSTTAGMVVLMYLLSRRMGGMGGREMTACFLKSAVAAGAMGVACYYVSAWVGNAVGAPVTRFSLTAPTGGASASARSLSAVGLQVLAACAVGAIVYYLVLRALRCAEIEEVVRRVRRRFQRQ
jgi:putative peptidoglycan lipid II flippase